VKAAAKTAPEFCAIADELGALELEMTKHEAAYAALHGSKLARIEQLRKTLRAACTMPAAKDWRIEGQRFMAILGPCGLKRSIDYRKLHKAIGLAAFAEFAECTLKTLEKCVKPEIFARVVSSDQSGPRSVSTVARSAA
jgi:hypothetical protein